MHTDYDTIWVDGPPGAGKTTLIERLLTSATSYDLAVARVRPGKSGTRRKKSTRDADQDRFKTAGASTVAVLHAVPDRSFGDLDEIDRFRDENRGTSAVLFEGAPVTRALRGELAVYVVRPLAEEVNLVSFGEKEVMRLDLNSYLSMMFGKSPVVHGEDTEEPPPDIAGSESEVVEEIEIPEDVGQELSEWAVSGVPIQGKGWVACAHHEGVVYGDVYLINLHKERERPAAERLAAEIRRIRADGTILRSFQSAPHQSRRISVFIANLSDPRDAELKKAIARIKRGLPRTRQEDDDADW